MEAFYYFNSPEKTLKHIQSKLLKEGGCCIIGIDHYLENTASLNWDKEFNLSLNTLSINDWIKTLEKATFYMIFLTFFLVIKLRESFY